MIALMIAYAVLYIALAYADRHTKTEEERKKDMWLFDHGLY